MGTLRIQYRRISLLSRLALLLGTHFQHGPGLCRRCIFIRPYGNSEKLGLERSDPFIFRWRDLLHLIVQAAGPASLSAYRNVVPEAVKYWSKLLNRRVDDHGAPTREQLADSGG